MFYQMMHIVHLKRYPFAFTHGTGTGRYQLTGSLPVRYWYHQGETEPRCYRTGISDDTYCTPEMERRSDDMRTVHYGGFATLVRYWNSRSPWFFQIDRYMEGTPGHISIVLSAVTGHISVAASARHVQKSGHTPISM